MAELLTLRSGNWYAWEMLPGYVGRPYFSPIRVASVEPLRSGQAVLRLRFFNACYAQGVQDFELDLRVLSRSHDYLIASIQYEGKTPADRCAIVSDVSFDWMQRNLPDIVRRDPPLEKADERESILDYLNRLFGE